MTGFFKMLFALAMLCLAAGNFCMAQTPPYFNVMTYGATGNGTTLDSPAINAAIAAAGAAGGGTVTFPPGTYLCGSIHLSNCPVNLTLYLSNNAVILASSNNIDIHESNPYSGYQDEGHSYFHDAIIWGENLNNFTIAGSGKIDGNHNIATGNPGSTTNTTPGDKALCLVLCSNITITGITITNGGHFGILSQACTNMLMTGARIWDSTARDAFDLDDCSFVVITNCDIEGSDDAMCLKSTYALGRKVGAQNIHIVNCQILSTGNNATQFGSETVGDFHDVTFSNLVLTGAGKAGIGITSQDGSIIDGVTYDNIIMSNCACPIWLKLDYRTTDTPHPAVGAIRNISINNVTAYHSKGPNNHIQTSTINGYITNNTTVTPIQNITFNNVNVSNIGGDPATAITNYPVETQDWQPQNYTNVAGASGWPSYGWYLRWAANISFTNCQAHFDNDDGRPAVIADMDTNILFNNFTADVGSNDTNYDMGFLTVSNFDVTNAVSSANSATALRIYTSNATPALIVSPPYFSPGDGLYTDTQLVTIASGTPGATIRYATDGTTPTSTSGTIYTNPVVISSETVLRAIAYTNGMVDSAVNTAIYYFPTANTAINNNFAFEAEDLSYTTNGATAALQSDSNASGGYWLALLATDTNQWIEFTISNLPAGTYDVQMSYKGLTTRGILAFTLDGTMLGTNLDEYSPSATYPTQDFGSVVFTNTSNHTVRLTVVGKNPASSSYALSVDQLIFIQTAPPLAANFVASPASGQLPLAVQFTDTSAGNPTNWDWDFGDGSTDSSAQNPSHTYDSAGNFIVTLNVIGPVGQTAETNQTIVVTPPPAVTNFFFEAESIPFITNGAVAVVQTDANSSGGEWMALEAISTNGYPYIQYTLANVPAGTYQLNLKYKGNTERGIITHQVDGVPLGDMLDQYSSGQTYPELSLGNFTFTNSGNHTVRQTVIGKNSANTSQPWASADRFALLLIQPPQPNFNGALTFSNGMFQLGGAGFPTLPYRLQANTNLNSTNWITIATIYADANGALTFMDTNTTSQSSRFYRIVTP